MDKIILHSDANCFYASVECVLHPELKDKAIAVCGDPEKRHGIVLTKSEKAKKAGVKTGMANWQARSICPELLIIEPHYDQYIKYSGWLQDIYRRYTDRIEPFGLDECWLDVSGNGRSGREIAEEIRESVKAELGITVSVGVSFNKVLAKLGSDMKKPDAVTEISRENFKEKVWPLNCSDLLFCGPSATRQLRKIGVHTVGQLANLPGSFAERMLGKSGRILWLYANGEGSDSVACQGYEPEAKSVGHGLTGVTDVKDPEEAHRVITGLAQDVGYKLRMTGMKAGGVSLNVRDSELACQGWQRKFSEPTQDDLVLIRAADELLKNYGWGLTLRTLTVSAIYLSRVDEPEQQSLFVDYAEREKREQLLSGIDKIRQRYGSASVMPASMMEEKK